MQTRLVPTNARLLATAAMLLSLPWTAIGCGAGPSAPTDKNAADARSASAEPDEHGEVLLAPIDPALIQYRQTGSVKVAMREVRALAVGPEEQFYVGGDKAIHVLDPRGEKPREIALDDQPRCLAIGNADHASPGRIYVGMTHRIEVLDAAGAKAGTWDTLGPKALLTSIAAAEQDVFVADAGNRIVWHFDTAGKRLGRIGQRDEARKIPGFVITSPYFDLAVAPDGLLRVVNPRALRIEAYTFRGDLEAFWGKSSPTIDGFFGCCNPAHFAMLSDGRFVTSEKGIARVKIYSPEGKFLCVVAEPEQLSVTPVDVAADAKGRILLLDPVAKIVRVFEHKDAVAGGKP